MNFKTNLNKFSLLSNTTIKIYLENKVIDFIPPNINTYFNDLDFMEFKFFLKYDYKQVKDFSNFTINSQYDFFLILLKEDKRKDLYLSYFSKLFPNLIYKNSAFYVQDTPLIQEEYMLLLDFLEVSCGEKDLESFLKQLEPKPTEVKKDTKNKELTALAEKMKENENKLKELKKSKKQEEKNGITIDQIVIAILYEFPSFSLENILRMNVFSVLYLWENVGKVIDTQIQKIAAGNGLLKDFTYFIN